MPAHHPAHADRQGDGGHGWQGFRHGGHGEGDACLQDGVPGHAVDCGCGRNHTRYRDRQPGQPASQRIEPALERRRLIFNRIDQRADASELGVRASRDHDGEPRAAHHRRAQVRHVGAIGHHRIHRQRRDLLVGGDRLAGQGRLIGAEIDGLQQPDIRRHAVARVEPHDVARHEGLGWHRQQPPAPLHERVRRLQLQQRLHRAPGTPFGGESQHRIDHQHRGDGRGFEPIADEEGQDGRRDQQADHDTAELIAENHQGRDARRRRQTVGSRLRQPCRGRGVRQSFPVGLEVAEERLDVGVPFRARLRGGPGGHGGEGQHAHDDAF